MSTENIAVTGSEKVRKRKKLTAVEKWQIFLETSAKDAPVGEILRRRGVIFIRINKDTKASRRRRSKGT